jgi:hypothetical protein
MSLDVTLTRVQPTEVYHDNITHNLGAMAKAAGLYTALWRPEEAHITTADQLIPILQEGLAILKKTPRKFQKLNPPNGWGSYEGLIEFVENYLEACITHPDATVDANR